MNEILQRISIKRLSIVLNGLAVSPFSIPKLRGSFATKYPQFSLIHNHLENEKLHYAYPSIQFKTINGLPTIIGIGKGIDILKEVFMDISDIQIENKTIEIHEKSIRLDVSEIGQTNIPLSYRFHLPWMALNQKNHKEYKQLNWGEKREFLEKILRGNLMSLAKGFGYFIPNIDNIQVQTRVQPVYRNFKNQKMLCFTGEFETNFIIPDFLGIGKQTARGFGTVVSTSHHTLKKRSLSRVKGNRNRKDY